MRYAIIALPRRWGRPIATDFRMLAYAIACIRKMYSREVWIIDTDTGCCIDHYRAGTFPAYPAIAGARASAGCAPVLSRRPPA